MPYGAHETMEMHEMLMEKINTINHFNLYAEETRNPQLLEMIERHQQEEIRSYNELVRYTGGSRSYEPLPSNTDIQGMNHQQIKYGLNQPPQYSPQIGSRMNDRDIAAAMLICHKNGARSCAWAALECADPNLRRTLFNCAAACTDKAYEVFLYMNEQGIYQVPTLNNQTAETFLHSYQPVNDSHEAQYAGQTGAYAGFERPYSPYGSSGMAGQYGSSGMPGQYAPSGMAGQYGSSAMSGQYESSAQSGGYGSSGLSRSSGTIRQ